VKDYLRGSRHAAAERGAPRKAGASTEIGNTLMREKIIRGDHRWEDDRGDPGKGKFSKTQSRMREVKRLTGDLCSRRRHV